MFPIILVLFLIGFAFAVLALIQTARRPKGQPPPRALTLGYSILGMLCFVAAGVVMYVSA
jgi:hypothetical protein